MNSWHVRRKWRPSLGMIVSAVFLTVLALPLAVTGIFKLFDNELVRQTERELLAQSAVIASVCALEIEAQLAAGYPLGKAQPKKSDGPYNPTMAKLGLTRNQTLPPRPDARTSDRNLQPAVAEMGARISRIAQLTREKTLAGFRIVDTTGQVFAGSGEIGLSLAHVPEVAEALEGEQRSVVRARIKDQPDPPLSSISRSSAIRVFTAMPVIVEDRVAAVVYASRTPQSLAKYVYNDRWVFMFAALSALVAAAIIGFVFLRTVNGPMHALLKRTRSLGEGDRSALAPLDRYGTRELAQLSEGIFTTAKRLFDRTDFISTFAAHVSHELKSPLTSIQGAAELMRDSEATMSARERQKFLDNIVADTDRLTTTVAQLRDLAQADNPQLGSSTTIDTVTAKLVADGLKLALDVSGDIDVPVAISTDNAAIVLSHLIENAAHHDASVVELVVRKKGSMLVATLTDDGSGIAEGIREKIFEPFYTTERETGGTGMGLAIARTMLAAHGGSIQLGQSKRGAAFVIELPCAKPGKS